MKYKRDDLVLFSIDRVDYIGRVCGTENKKYLVLVLWSSVQSTLNTLELNEKLIILYLDNCLTLNQCKEKMPELFI